MTLELFALNDKVSIVTGASRGIGRAIALGLADAGADVVVAARSEEDLKTLAKEIENLGRRSLPVVTDVMKRDDIENLINRTVEEFGRLDILVNNAGGANFTAPLVAVRPSGWDKILRLNLDSVFHATQLGAQAMLQSGGGSIIQIASVAGIMGTQGTSFYSAAKGGVRLLTQSVAKELAQSGVRVNCIAPGWIDTELTTYITGDPEVLKWAESLIPMGRFGKPEEIVGAAVFLASDAATFVTGTTLVVDGGQTA